MSKKVYQIITESIINSLSEGTIPWRKPWISNVPTSLNTGKEYRGINHLLLSNLSDSQTQLYLTFNQAKKLGKKITKGSQSLPVVYHVFKDDEETNESKYLGARFYKVFPIECTDLSEVELLSLIDEELIERIKRKPITGQANSDIESFIASTIDKTSLKTRTSNKAYYVPLTHTIAMPSLSSFHSHDEYYATYFHELIHSTMDAMQRDAKGYKFGSHKYSFEELVAEIGAQFLCDHFQIINNTVENSNAYIKSWLRKFNDDSNMIIKAATQAQKAVDYLLALDEVGF